MKIAIEDSDVLEVKRILRDYLGLLLGDEQAKEMCLLLAWELYECNGHLDTQARDKLVDLLVNQVMENVPPSKTKNGKWAWPTYGDSAEYQKEFDEVFKKAAIAKGIGLEACWD